MNAQGQEAAAQLARLAEKYRLLAELRARREALAASGARAFGAREAKERRSAFRRLAREFPGALRELDTTPAEILRSRLEAVGETQRALESGARRDLPLWMEYALAYHVQLREALAIKRWLARRLPRGGELDPELLAAFRAWYGKLAFRVRTAGDLDLNILREHLNPPGGRLQAVVFEELERRFGRPREEIERLIFGTGPLPCAAQSSARSASPRRT